MVVLVETVAAVLLAAHTPVHARVIGNMQLSGSVIALSLGASIGAWMLWLLATLLLGRVYCSSFCVWGTLQDCVGYVRRLCGHRWRYREARPVRWWVLGVYVVAVAIGAGIVPLLLEPYAGFMNMLECVGGDAGTTPGVAATLGVGSVWGMVCATLSIAALAIYAWLTGRDFCNDVCPVGSILAITSARSAMHIELYPDRCTSCLRCEDVCKAGCIDIKTRTVDNARCVRCFNCVAECKENAIRYQLNRNGIVTPMMRRSSPTV